MRIVSHVRSIRSTGAPARALALAGATLTFAVTAPLASCASPLAAQGPPAGSAHAGHAAPAAAVGLSPQEVGALATLTVAIGQARDSAQKQLAAVRNKSPELQKELREALATRVGALLKEAGLTEAEYRRRTYIVTTDPTARRAFDETFAKLTGGPLPSQVAAATVASAGPAAGAGGAPPTLPAGPVGAHLGHVLTAFGDTPEKRGLLPTALAEAQTAAQHAALAGRDPNDLAGMQRHAAHVLQALDPSAAKGGGPGLGYGVKRAALATAAHVEMAGAAPGAPPPVAAHAGHVATAARNAARRADEAVALVQRIETAKTAPEAAALVSQLVSLTNEIVAGRDENADGRIDWKEGGLQQADEHARLLATAAASAASAAPPTAR